MSSSAILSLSSKRRQKEDSNECEINQVFGDRGDVGRGGRDRLDHRIRRRKARTSRLSVQDERDGGRHVREREPVGTDFVVSGTISSALTFSSDVPYRVTLDGAAVSETITLAGDATLWLVGDSVIETTAATAVSSTGTLTIGGAGSVTLASSPTKKQTGPVVAENLVVAGGNVSIVLNADVKNVAGITLTGDYVQVAGTVDIDCASDWDWERTISLPSLSG